MFWWLDQRRPPPVDYSRYQLELVFRMREFVKEEQVGHCLACQKDRIKQQNTKNRTEEIKVRFDSHSKKLGRKLEVRQEISTWTRIKRKRMASNTCYVIEQPPRSPTLWRWIACRLWVKLGWVVAFFTSARTECDTNTM